LQAIGLAFFSKINLPFAASALAGIAFLAMLDGADFVLRFWGHLPPAKTESTMKKVSTTKTSRKIDFFIVPFLSRDI